MRSRGIGVPGSRRVSRRSAVILTSNSRLSCVAAEHRGWGGGGGVLINGEGPGLKESGEKWSRGQGYGGGGTAHADDFTDPFGQLGVIIVEVVGI